MWKFFYGNTLPPANVWLGVSVENQEQADKRIPWLSETLAAVHFLSIEPLLEKIIIPDLRKIRQVIVGGESGPGARPMHPDWARSIRDQCKEAGVAFFIKQMSGGKPIPKDLMVREYP